MTQPRSISPDPTDKEYLRQCTLRNPAFVTALRDFRKRSPSPPSFPPPQVGLRMEAIKQSQAQQRGYIAEVIEFCNRWPSITPGDVIGDASSSPGPRVQLAPYSPATWPRDGSLLLRVHLTAIGDEVKSGFQRIKRDIAPKKRDRRKGGQKKVSIQEGTLNLEPGKESIILRVGQTATGDDVKREFQRAKRTYWPRRLGTKSKLKISIYDLYYNGRKTFQQIASETSKSISTVYDLLISACRDIGQVRDQSKSE